MHCYLFDEKSKKLIESLRVPLAVYQYIDKRVAVLALSDGFCDLFEFDSHEEAYKVMSTDMYSTAHPDDAARLADAAHKFSTEGGRFEAVYRLQTHKSLAYKIIHANGEHITTETGDVISYVWYTDEGAYSGTVEDSGRSALNDNILSDAFRRALREESMVHQSYYDALTGMPNMTYFFDIAESRRKVAAEEGKKPLILFADLSGMKFFNSKYGFAEGDKLLQRFAKVLAQEFGNDNCGHFGQDHFVVYTDAEGIEERLNGVFEKAEKLNEGKTLHVRVGIYHDDNTESDIAVACDKAMFACNYLKGFYGSAFNYFDEKMMIEATNRRYVIENLDRALEEGWIKVHYQPIIRAANGKVSDEEALSRWIDPEKGVLSPAEFIPAIEDAKLIYKLDLFVVEEALKTIGVQRSNGLYAVPVSVNLSRHDFDSCDIVEEIRRRVDESGVGRDMLSIEITESVIGSDFNFIKEQVERFRKLGFKVWMDDFGSGYSSLDVLQSIRFDLLKLDMRFIQQSDCSEESRIILTELIKMAIGMGIDTVCEGVETVDQVEFLREIGCTKLQGYFFSKPIPLDEIMKRYETGTGIGFENPKETDYYAAIGRINLYDTAVISREDQESFRHYFNTIPMAIIESDGKFFKLVRCNSSYRSFMDKMFGSVMIGVPIDYEKDEGRVEGGFLNALRKCGIEGSKMFIDVETDDGSTAHAFIKRIAVNPVNGTAAVAVAVLSLMNKNSQNVVTYAHIAKALSAD